MVKPNKSVIINAHLASDGSLSLLGFYLHQTIQVVKLSADTKEYIGTR